MLQSICNRGKYFFWRVIVMYMHIECNEDVDLHEKTNAMALNFTNGRYIKTVWKQLSISGRSPLLRSNQITGIEIRMLPPLIKNNTTLAVWPFPGRAHLYCLTIVMSDVANQLAGHIDLNTFPGVGDNEHLQINKTVFYWEPTSNIVAPGQVHIMSTIIKSKDGLRNSAEILSQLKDDTAHQDIIDQILSLDMNASPLSTLTELFFQIAKDIGRHLGKVHDVPLGTVINSFTRLHGDWDLLGVSPVTINTRNVDFHFELIVRDNS